MTDDHGAGDAGCYGSTDIPTPHIDALAKRGLRFTQFYAAAPVCSPSRAALLTGRYPLVCGVPSNAASQKGHAGGLPASEVTMAEMFQNAGYVTGHFGKWHLGYTPDTLPNAQGFTHSFGHMGGCIDNYSHFFYWAGPNVHDLWRNGREVFHDGTYFPELMVREAVEFIEANKAKPFFIYFALNTPHYPYQPSERLRERFKGLPYPRNLYAAFLADSDERIGALVATVDQLGLRENTIIIFQSDNGHSTEQRAHFGGGSAGRYRGAKFSLFEGGIRLPAIVSWPGRLPQDEVRTQLAHGCDWLPTLAELCGLKPAPARLDGKSIASVLKSGSAPTPHTVVHWQVGDGPNAQWAVREGDWKLIGNAWDTTSGDTNQQRFAFWLSNLAGDPEEKRNHAGEHPQVTSRLKEAHSDWLKAARAERRGDGSR